MNNNNQLHYRNININDIEGEEWRTIPGFTGYSASSLGRIRNDVKNKLRK